MVPSAAVAFLDPAVIAWPEQAEIQLCRIGGECRAIDADQSEQRAKSKEEAFQGGSEIAHVYSQNWAV